MIRIGLLVAAVLATAWADSPYETTYTFTSGTRADLKMILDVDQSWVVTSLGEGMGKEAGIKLGDRMISANGESAVRQTNFWMVTHLDVRPLEMVFRSGSKADQECTQDHLAQAYEFVEKADHVGLRELLEVFKCDVTKTLEGKLPLMHVAASVGKIANVKVLAFYGANVNEKVNGDCPIHTAAKLGHTFAVHVLAESGARVDEINDEGNMPFHIGAALGWTEVLKVLRHRDATWQATNRDGKNALQLAQAGDDLKTVPLLEAWWEQQRKEDAEAFKGLMGEKDEL